MTTTVGTVHAGVPSDLNKDRDLESPLVYPMIMKLFIFLEVF